MAAETRWIIKDRACVADPWQTLADEAPLPAAGDVIVSWARWVSEQAHLRAHPGRIGARCPSTINPAAAPELLDGLSLVALEFLKFADGRGYSYARMLRERCGFRGEVRAVGEVLRDQLFYLWRCGVDAFELAAGRDLDDALRAFSEFSADYQPGTPARAGG